MSEINVISRTQKIIVEPISRSVNVINLGQMGPAGPPGLEGAPGASGGGEVSDRWVWISSAQTSPGTIAATRCAVNHDSPSSATWLLIHKESSNNNTDYGATIVSLRDGDHIYLQQKTDATKFHRYELTGTPFLQGGTTWNIPVVTDSGSPIGTEPNNGTDILVAFQFTGGYTLPLGGTTNQYLVKDSAADGDASWQTLSLPTNRIASVTEAGTTYSPVASDENKLIQLTNSGAITVSLPSNATTSIPVDAEFHYVWWGVGQPTFVAGSGATADGTPGLKLRARYSGATAKKLGTNAWWVSGDLSA